MPPAHGRAGHPWGPTAGAKKMRAHGWESGVVFSSRGDWLRMGRLPRKTRAILSRFEGLGDGGTTWNPFPFSHGLTRDSGKPSSRGNAEGGAPMRARNAPPPQYPPHWRGGGTDGGNTESHPPHREKLSTCAQQRWGRQRWRQRVPTFAGAGGKRARAWTWGHPRHPHHEANHGAIAPHNMERFSTMRDQRGDGQTDPPRPIAARWGRNGPREGSRARPRPLARQNDLLPTRGEKRRESGTTGARRPRAKGVRVFESWGHGGPRLPRADNFPPSIETGVFGVVVTWERAARYDGAFAAIWGYAPQRGAVPNHAAYGGTPRPPDLPRFQSGATPPPYVRRGAASVGPTQPQDIFRTGRVFPI